MKPLISKKKNTHLRLWILEDDVIMRAFFEKVLKAFNLYWFESSFEANKELKQSQPNLVLIDGSLKYGGITELCKTLRKRFPTLPIIVFSSHQSLSDRLEVLSAGADLFLPKPLEPEELQLYIINFLKRVMHQKPKKSPSVQELSYQKFRLSKTMKRCWFNDQELKLRPAIFDTFWVLLTQMNQPVSRQHIANSIWNQEKQRSLRTIDQFIKTLRQELKQAQASKDLYIETLYGKGYCLRSFSKENSKTIS